LRDEARPLRRVDPDAQLERRAPDRLLAPVTEELEPALVHFEVTPLRRRLMTIASGLAWKIFSNRSSERRSNSSARCTSVMSTADISICFCCSISTHAADTRRSRTSPFFL